MKLWYKLAYVLSPLALVAFRIHTRLTGQQRARLLVFNEHGEVLLLRSAVGHRRWSMPGGGIDRGEDPAVGATRELYEETGIKIDPQDLRSLGIMQRPDIPVNFVMHLYTTKIKKAALATTLHNPLEIMEVAWFKLDNLPENLSTQLPPALTKLSNNEAV